MDVIFYFVISLLIATVFCYLIFLLKNNIQKTQIKEEIAALETVGTYQQKEYEKSVISYQQKIKDFSTLFQNHEFASHVFAFMQYQTMPNIWFSQFTLDKKGSKAQLLGEADNMENFSRQVAGFETNEYVKNVSSLNSSLGEGAKVQFNINLSLDSKLFSYVPETENIVPIETIFIEENVSPSDSNIFNNPSQDSKKLITVFDILLSPEVIGVVDQINHTIAVDVPYGTDVTNLIPLIIISPEAVVSPESSVAQDFTNPIVYWVTAKDGSAQDYTVTVNVLPKEGTTKNKSNAGIVFAIIGLILAVVLTVLGAFFILKKKQKRNEI
ncbi:MAG: DUF5018 domain-containing protein [Candidatus Staskawiczbacteria bacterium]|nr:DUF5018 domain-containing protein [Candidatus Staskawiczbacteria bacterium]